MNTVNTVNDLKVWYNREQVSVYDCAADNTGRSMRLREVLFSQFAVPHRWFYKESNSQQWINGISNDLDTIIKLRTGEISKGEKTILKQTMQCFTPAGYLRNKKKGHIEVVHRTNLMQLDFDEATTKDYDLDELKQAVFSLPFIAFCGLSCSGNGFYALAMIAEPERLNEYAEHCFQVLKEYGIPPDTTKGRNVNDLRFVSYDANMLIRDNPEPLKVKRFKHPNQKIITSSNMVALSENSSALVNKALNEISAAVIGTRWQTVQKWSYTLAGLSDRALLDQIKSIINSSPNYNGEESKYCACAEACFSAGYNKPLTRNAA